MKFLAKFELKFAILFLLMSIFFGTNNSWADSCPSSPTCTYTAVSGSNYTVNSGETICIPNGVNYSSGTITLNGGNVYVASGGTLNMSNISNGSTGYTITSTTAASPIVVTTSASHGYSTGDLVGISGTTSTDARGNWTITVINSTSFSLNNSSSSTSSANGTAKKFGKVTNCGTISSYGNLAFGMDLYNYGTVPGTIGNNSAGGDFYNYTTTTLSVNNFDGGSVVYNMSGNSMTLTMSNANNYPRVVNSGTMTLAGFISSTGYLTNKAGASITLTGNITAQSGGTINNYGTFNMGSNSLTINTGSTVNNYYGGTFTDGTTDMNGGSLYNRGEFTSTTLTYSSSSSRIYMYDAAKFTFSAIGTFNAPNPVFNYSGTASSCAYINTSGFTYSNSTALASTATGIKICGTPGTAANGVSSKFTSITAATPAVITSASHGFSDGVVVQVVTNVGSISAGYYMVANATTNTYTLKNLSTGADITSSNTNTGGSVKLSNFGTSLSLGSSGCTYSGCSAPLPIELLSFDAKPQNDEVLVNWTSATEFNNQYYTILRSLDGVYFEPVGVVMGAGNSSQPIEYHFIDQNPLSGISYYKLQQTDFDGKSESFNIVTVNYKLDDNAWILYPNPTNGNELYIKFLGKTSSTESPVLVYIFDLAGKEIFNTILENYSKQESLLNTSNELSKGVYLVKVRFNDAVRFERLVVK